MSLNQPCYTLNLTDAPPPAHPPSSRQDKPVLMILQTKLFSGIGGAGLLALDSVPSVRIVRGQGMFSERQWQVRTDFQQSFARFNQAAHAASEIRFEPVRLYAGPQQGWIDEE